MELTSIFLSMIQTVSRPSFSFLAEYVSNDQILSQKKHYYLNTKYEAHLLGGIFDIPKW